jgi:hypothetical protein
LTDAATESFARPYASANWEKFKQAIQNLLEEGVIDRIIEAPLREEEIKRVNLRWFGLYCAQPKAANGQPTYTTLYGFEKCRGEYVLQLDSDCIIHRASRNHDYLGEILSVFEKDPLAVTVSVPIAHKNKQPFLRERNGRSFRVETRCSLLDLRRLQSLLPLTNEVDSGVLKLPWHRSLDFAVSEGRATSYRGGDPQTCFIHMPNSRKSDINGWINTIDCIEHGTLLKEQMGNVELVGQTADWIGRRNEEMVLILRGKDIPLSKIRRSLQSLQRQCFQKWSAVIVDAGSSNGTNDFCQFVIRRSFGSRVSFVSNHIAVTPMENIDFVASEVCTNPMSIIVHLDLDDALIGGNALDKIVEAYRNGADVTVGSILRTDKQAKYSVSFEDPRANRGGNVWQHLRTYRKYLYDKVPKDYFKINGEWVPHTEDWAFMIPIVELAKNPMNIKNVIYFYEPSEQKMCRTIKEREQIVAKLIAKPRLEAQD